MSNLPMRYMTVSMDIQPEGFNLCCWMSTENFFASQLVSFPHEYMVRGDDHTWLLQCNIELTVKFCMNITEQADKILREQRAINERRKIANR